MIRRLILSAAVCIVCLFSKADNWSNDVSIIRVQISLLNDRLRLLLNTVDSIDYTTCDATYTVLYESVLPACDLIVANINDLVSDIHSLRLSVGDQLGNDVFQISRYVGAMGADLSDVNSTLTYATEQVLLMLQELQLIRDFGFTITETIQTISDSIDDDLLENQRRIITLLEDIGTMLNWGSDLQNMAEDLAYIRQVFEEYANAVQSRLYHIDTYQSELNTYFTTRFRFSQIPSYNFPFYYAYTSLEIPTSPSHWQIDYTDYTYDGSPNGILEEIGQVLTHILEGESNASLMLANIVKSLAHEDIDTREKQDEYLSLVDAPLQSARSLYQEHFSSSTPDGAVNVSPFWLPVVNEDQFNEIVDTSDYRAALEQFVVDELGEATITFEGLTLLPGLNSITANFNIGSFSWLLAFMRAIFGAIYWVMFIGMVFFSVKLAIKGYNVLLSCLTSTGR